MDTTTLQNNTSEPFNKIGTHYSPSYNDTNDHNTSDEKKDVFPEEDECMPPDNYKNPTDDDPQMHDYDETTKVTNNNNGPAQNPFSNKVDDYFLIHYDENGNEGTERTPLVKTLTTI